MAPETVGSDDRRGLGSLNGQAAETKLLQFWYIGNGSELEFASNAHTLNIPMASTATVTAGLISKTDYDNFNESFLLH